MKTIAFIVQRYGLEINGGAEQHCRQLAEQLSIFYNIEVLTTCALDTNWGNHFPEGTTTLNNITLRRFEVSRQRDRSEMKKLSLGISTNEATHSLKKKLKKFVKRYLLYPIAGKKTTTNIYEDWVLAQGPTTPRLLGFLKENEKNYDCLVFFTYLYYPTVFGIETNPAKTIFLPMAHDEWPIYLPIYQKMFHIPSSILYNTAAEKKFVNRLFHNEHVYSEIAGVGIDIPEIIPIAGIKEKMNINADYILYIGRINSKKFNKKDFRWVLKYLEETGKDIKLVLIGNADMKIPSSKHILHFGHVDENTKFNLLKNCLFLIQPSRLESLSIVVLESFAMSKPVLVRKDCEVMRDHIDLSHGGYYYDDYKSFKNAFDQLVNDQLQNIQKGKAGKLYVDQNYRWENVIAKFRYAIDDIIPART